MSIVSSNLKDDKLIGRRDVEAIIAYSKNLYTRRLKANYCETLQRRPA
jgi:hypothetical protein